MITPQTPNNEAERIEALNRYNILDTLPEKEYDAITYIASQICGTPIALISLVDPDRQWFKSHHGLDATETPRDIAFCAHAINTPEEVFIVPDATKDVRFHDNPLTTGDTNVIFYAGAPLNTSDGNSLGTLCVIDNQPREITPEQTATLKALADQVISQLELRLKNRQLQDTNDKIIQLNKDLDSFAHTLSHDLKTPIRGIASVASWIKDEYEEQLDEQGVEWLDKISERTIYMESLVQGMLEYAHMTRAEIEYNTFSPFSLVNEVAHALILNESITIDQDINIETLHHYEAGWRSILQNLISNSIKYSDNNHPVIGITVNGDDEKVEIIYTDNGPGIPEKMREKVFKLFGTIGNKTKDSTGIGLATIQSIVTKLKGTIELSENQPKGVKFIFTFPNLED
ncbi:MAG: hypothetical protein SchgKO_15900 [Schleiferiaceae bacterium]